MQEILCDTSPRGSGRRRGWSLRILATVLLSCGVGAATAAFTLMSAVSGHAAPFVACETMLSGSASMYGTGAMPSADEVEEHVTDAYRATYESSYQGRNDVAGDPVRAWSDVTDDLDARSLAPLFAAGALAMLVACARGAARMLAAPDALEIVGVSAMGALVVSSMLITVLGLPAMGFRAVAFAVCVSLLAARFARMTRTYLLPATA
jgi:hypothetical protein